MQRKEGELCLPVQLLGLRSDLDLLLFLLCPDLSAPHPLTRTPLGMDDQPAMGDGMQEQLT